jgi:transposase
MALARVVIPSGTVEGRSKSEIARDFGVSRRWVQKLCRRYATEGEAALEPRSRRPKRSPKRTSILVEDAIVELRKGPQCRHSLKRLGEVARREAHLSSDTDSALAGHVTKGTHPLRGRHNGRVCPGRLGTYLGPTAGGAEAP